MKLWSALILRTNIAALMGRKGVPATRLWTSTMCSSPSTSLVRKTDFGTVKVILHQGFGSLRHPAAKALPRAIRHYTFQRRLESLGTTGSSRPGDLLPLPDQTWACQCLGGYFPRQLPFRDSLRLRADSPLHRSRWPSFQSPNKHLCSWRNHAKNIDRKANIKSAQSIVERPAYFLFGRWVSAEPAADLAALLALGLRSTLDAADAAFLPVTSRFFFRAIAITSFSSLLGATTLKYFLP